MVPFYDLENDKHEPCFQKKAIDLFGLVESEVSLRQPSRVEAVRRVDLELGRDLWASGMHVRINSLQSLYE